MAHQLQLKKKKYRNWVRAGLGLKYTQEGLQSFCEDIVGQQHADIINDIKQRKNPQTVTCGQCSLKTLKPDHVKAGNKQCPLGQKDCNYWYPGNKIACPNNVCDDIYDQIIRSHGSTPPAPYWKNTDIQKWCTDPWSIAKCFINASGYDQKSSAAEIDCTGLLHLIINNTEFHKHVQKGKITGEDVFSKVRGYRNTIFHSSTMELEDDDLKNYITDMIAVLQDNKELINRPDSQIAVLKLKELEKEDFFITTQSEAEVFSASIEAIKTELQEKIEVSESKTRESLDKLPTLKDMGQIGERVAALESDMAETTTKEDVRQLDQRVAALELDKSEQARKEDVIKLHKRVDALESNMTEQIRVINKELENLKSIESSQQGQHEYIKAKLEFQKELIKLYKGRLLKMSVLPLKPQRNLTDIGSVYTQPRMFIEKDDAKSYSRQPEGIEITSMKEIFVKDGQSVKSIYIVGEAGSGKSTFCKSLVSAWCSAHSEQNADNDEFGGVEEMKKFEFLFYIPLSHVSDTTSIREMLNKISSRPILQEILDNESDACLILLDGLDEWVPPKTETPLYRTEGLPIQDEFMDYTVVTTTRPWKLETLQITDNEIQLKVKLMEFGEAAVKSMINRTVSILNEEFGENKNAKDCEEAIENISVSDIKHTPIMLQQIICLWFDGKLHGTSRCAIYSAIMELFFEWNAKMIQKDPSFPEMKKRSETLQVKLPNNLNDIEACQIYSCLIENMSRLAYETLFNNKREMSVSFDSSSFKRFGTSDGTRNCCLKLGILSEEKEDIPTASQCQSSRYSFVHKSEQEFLAAVYIAILANTKANDRADNSMKFIHDTFKCAAVPDILDKTNVFIMLCGLEPDLAPNISEYICNIVSADKQVQEYRRSVTISDLIFGILPKEEAQKVKSKRLLLEIQNCIYSCMDEYLAWDTSCETPLYLSDVIINSDESCERFLQYCDKNVISLDKVRLLDMTFRTSNQVLYSALKYFQGCDRLATFKLTLRSTDQKLFTHEGVEYISNILKANGSSLKSISVATDHEANLVTESLVRCLPSMRQLVALQIRGESMTHEQCNTLCSFLSRAANPKQLTIDIHCASKFVHLHYLDLSQYENLQMLNISQSFFPTSINTSNLEVISACCTEDSAVELLDGLSKASKLKYLKLTLGKLPRRFNEEMITDALIEMLSSLHQLQGLMLLNFTFTGNIFTRPAVIKVLQDILFIGVRMCLTSWRDFVDSLTVIPRSVDVCVGDVNITLDGEEYNLLPFTLGERGEEAAAFQYVREQHTLFTVERENIQDRTLVFSTKK